MLLSEDRKAAWKILIEIKTRISAVEFTDDCDVNQAFESLYRLFGTIRETIGDHPLCDEVCETVLPFFNGVYRDFITRWGKRCREINRVAMPRDEFIKEVRDFQEQTKPVCAALRRIVDGRNK